MIERNEKAARSGDRRRALEEARDTLARAIDRAEAADAGTVAQLVAQYRGTLKELAEIYAAEAVPEEVSPLDRIVDDLATRREARGGVPADRQGATRRRKPSAG